MTIVSRALVSAGLLLNAVLRSPSFAQVGPQAYKVQEGVVDEAVNANKPPPRTTDFCRNWISATLMTPPFWSIVIVIVDLTVGDEVTSDAVGRPVDTVDTDEGFAVGLLDGAYVKLDVVATSLEFQE